MWKSKIKLSSFVLKESQAILTCDGVVLHQLTGDETIKITKAKRKLKLVKVTGFSYFETLYNKLGWQS